MSENKEFHYEIDPNFDFTIDERGNSFMALRRIKWGNRENYSLDLRKYISTEEGERMQKGVSFLTEEGPHELVKVLVENDYGRPEEIADIVCNKRKDIFDAISKTVNGIFPTEYESDDNDSDEEPLYDTRRLFDDE